MAYHKPTPEDGKRDGSQGALRSYVQVEKIAQIAFILPCAVIIGWLGGAWLGTHLHQSWMTITGIVVGCVAGMTSAIRLAMSSLNGPGDKSDSGSGGE